MTLGDPIMNKEVSVILTVFMTGLSWCPSGVYDPFLNTGHRQNMTLKINGRMRKIICVLQSFCYYLLLIGNHSLHFSSGNTSRRHIVMITTLQINETSVMLRCLVRNLRK